MLVVLTGAGAAAEPVRAQLESAGATVVTVPDDVGGGAAGGRAANGGAADGGDAVASAVQRAGAGKVGAYIQLPTVLPVEGQSAGGSLVARMGQFLADGLLARFRLAAAVLPHLNEDTTVVLVGGNTPVPGTAVDDQEARLALLRVLAHALRAEEAPRHLRVRVLPHGTAPDTVARTALGETVPEPTPQHSPPAGDSDVDLSYADWRTQVLGLATVEF